MAGEDQKNSKHSRYKSWLKRFFLVLAVIFIALIAFHRPILHAAVRAIAIHFAAKENLKLDLRIEGSLFSGVVIKNIHATPFGPSAIESLDVGEVIADYSLIDLFRHGLPDLLKNIEVHSLHVIIDPAKAPPVVKPVKQTSPSLPKVFPERLVLSDINCIIRGISDDVVIRGLDLSLLPEAPGELSFQQLKVPSLHDWENIAAATSYTHKNLVLRNLVLDDKTKFQLVKIDASHLTENLLKVGVDGALAGGTLSTVISLQQKGDAFHTDLTFSLSHLSAASLSEYFGRPEKESAGDIQAIKGELHGTLDAPQTWTGGFEAHLSHLQQGKLTVESIDLQARMGQGRAQLESLDLVQGKNVLRAQGSVQLPKTVSEFSHEPANLHFKARIPDLREATASLSQPVSGDAEIGGSLSLEGGVVTADLSLEANKLGTSQGTVEKIAGSLKATKRLPGTGQAEPYFTALSTQGNLEITKGQVQKYAFDNMTVEIQSKESAVTLDRAVINRKSNVLSIRGDYLLPVDPQKALQQPATISLSLVAPEVGDYWDGGESPDRVTGRLDVSGEVRMRGKLADGALSLWARNIRARNLTISHVSSQIAVSGDKVYLNDLTASLNDQDYVSAWAQIALTRPYPYSGKLLANIADLSTFNPLLAGTSSAESLQGALVVNWEGHGEAAAFSNTGHLTLKLEKGRFAKLQGLQANIEATYSPEALDIPVIYFGNEKMDFQAILQAKGEVLEISQVQIDQGKARFASGYVSLPFVWKNLGTNAPLFPPAGKVNVTFQTENLDLKTLFDDLAIKPPATGVINTKLDAQGTFAALVARLDVQMRDLRVPQQPKLEPGSVDLALRLANDQLSLTGKVQQAKIQPLQVEANAPLNVAKLVQTKKIPEDTPLTAKLHLPKSSVNFVRQFVPAIRDLDGDLSLDVAVNGTLGKPLLSGAADMNINIGRFTNPTLPALNGFKARLNFDHDALTFEKFGGELAGGPFSLAGRVTLPKLTEINLDLRFKAESVLLARSDTLTVRADADVRVSGPLNSANVTGNVALTNSQFLKNLDLIPIGLPGRPAPQPPSSPPNISFPQPPLRDWKFNVAIKTKDPFLLRGNLANGGAVVDLHLIGTGLHPGIDGVVRLENVEATLPFSRLQITQGFLYFDPNDSLNPRIDLQGTSQIRDYIIHVYVYGTATAPEVVFTSEPPLPQEEIISLLATGTTRQELAGSGDALAGRALMLLGQQLYRKVFKKGAPTKSNPVFDRLQVDVGNTDPRTGQQSATARFKVNDHVFLIGDVAVGGDFRGLIKYLIRFR